MSPVSEVSPVTPAARRPRLITPHGLAVVAVTVAASLAVLFPGLDFGHPRFLAHPDELSIAYLDQVLRQRPDDRSARLLLARQQAGARQVVRGGGQPASAGREARRRDHLAGAPRAGGAGARRGRRAAAVRRGPRRAAGDRIARAATDRDRADRGRRPHDGDLARIAEVALALESPGDAAAIYERLASQEPARRREWALLAGRWYRAAGHLPESAVAYLAASAAAGPRDDGAADLLAAIDVLRATDDGARALQVIEQAIGRWPADRRLLARAVDLALAAERRPPRPELRGAPRRARARRRFGCCRGSSISISRSVTTRRRCGRFRRWSSAVRTTSPCGGVSRRSRPGRTDLRSRWRPGPGSPCEARRRRARKRSPSPRRSSSTNRSSLSSRRRRGIAT